MKPTRRAFLKTSLAASVITSLSQAPLAAADKTASREFYDLRSYRLKQGASQAPLDAYLEKALIPALNARGISNVGVFIEIQVDRTALTSKPKENSPVWVLIPHSSLESFVTVSADINTDPAVLKAGAGYLNAAKANPAFDRIDAWLLRAFAGMPKMELASFIKNRVPTRIFEMRDYESHSEERALNKMEMFNAGETQIMRDLGLSPVFFGQAVAGPNLPHLRYITGGADLATHLANWKKFGPDPRWTKLKDDPRYKDNTSKNTSRMIAPTTYSQI